MKPLPPIPIPWRERWQDIRLQLLPILVFSGAVIVLGVLWKDHLAAPSFVGQAEPVLVNVASPRPGVLVGLTVQRFQSVKAGDLIAQVLVADPRLLESSLAVIRAEIELLRVSLDPIAQQQRNAVDYSRLRLDWMQQRAALATAQVQSRLAEAEWRRSEELFREQILSASLRDQAQAAYAGSQREVEELTRLVAEVERSFATMQPGESNHLAQVSDAPLRAAIAVQETRLRQVEAELAPILLRAPMEGIVATVFHHSGEAVIAAQPVVAIATVNPVRIVGYLRSPVPPDLQAGRRVQVRTRGLRREAGEARIIQVGPQFDTIPDALVSPAKLTRIELGLPLAISLPPNLKLLPGELVDINVLSKGP